MTKDEILQLVKEHFDEEWCEEDGHGWVEFAGKPDAFVKFALLINEKGYNRGYKEGYGEGRYDGYESAKVSTEMNTMEFDDD